MEEAYFVCKSKKDCKEEVKRLDKLVPDNTCKRCKRPKAKRASKKH